MATSTQWNDILIRKSLNDTGTVPYNGGTWTASPDIIPNGTLLAQDPATAYGPATYGQDLGQPTVFEQMNYFYVRGKNLSAAADPATVNLYYCPSNLFLFPSLWVGNQLQTSSGVKSVPINAADVNQVVVTAEPFAYVPTNQTHSCLIAQVCTKAHPNPLPADGVINSMDALGQYICNNPNMGWRNIDLVSNDIPTYTKTFSLDTTSLEADSGGQFLLGISFKNLAVGSSLAFSSGTPIPSGPDQGKLIQLVKSAVSQSNGSLGTSYLTIPGGFKTNVSFTYWANTPIMPNWEVKFFAILTVNPGSDLLRHALPVHALDVGLERAHPLANLGNDGITVGIRVGDITVRGV